MDDTERWNHNIHYHRVILDAVPAGAQRALDVGCGEGMLTRQLATVVPEVIGIDVDRPSIDLARQRPNDGVRYEVGDVLDHDLEPASFDFVASVAALHHLGAETGLRRLRELVRPGGALVIIGLARSRYPRDLPWELAGAIGTRLLKLRRTYWEHSAPTVWPPPETHRELRAIAEDLLPDVAYRRRLLWRYSLVWTRPDT